MIRQNVTAPASVKSPVYLKYCAISLDTCEYLYFIDIDSLITD